MVHFSVFRPILRCAHELVYSLVEHVEQEIYKSMTEIGDLKWNISHLKENILLSLSDAFWIVLQDFILYSKLSVLNVVTGFLFVVLMTHTYTHIHTHCFHVHLQTLEGKNWSLKVQDSWLLGKKSNWKKRSQSLVRRFSLLPMYEVICSYIYWEFNEEINISIWMKTLVLRTCIMDSLKM